MCPFYQMQQVTEWLFSCRVDTPTPSISVSTRSFDRMTTAVCCEKWRFLLFDPWLHELHWTCVRVIPFLLPLRRAYSFPVQIPEFLCATGKRVFELCVLKQFKRVHLKPSFCLCVWRERVRTKPAIGDAWGLLHTVTLRAYPSACWRFTFI